MGQTWLCLALGPRRFAMWVVVTQTYGQSGTGKTRLMQGSLQDAGILPRTIAYMFALRKNIKALMSLRMVEVRGHTITDLLTTDVLRTAAVEEGAIHASMLQNEVVHEVLLRGRTRALQLLAEVVAACKRRAHDAESYHGSPTSAPAGRPHVIAVFRVERDSDGKVATLYVADLSGTQDAEAGAGSDKQSFRTVVQTNSNLVMALCCVCCFARS